MKSNNVYARYYLSHHGIKGQKWGVMNGPPYPLGASAKSYREKKAEKEQFHLSDRQKAALKIGTAAVAACLAGYALYKTGALDNFRSVGENEIERLLEIDVKPKPSGDFPTQLFNDIPGGKESLGESLRTANPLRGTPEGRNNCVFSAVAGFLRQYYGKDVVALSTGGEQQMLGGIVEECFKGATVFDGSAVKFGKSPDDAAEMLVKRFGENAAGVVSIQWKRDVAFQGGHTFSWDITNGRVSFRDFQAGKDNSYVRQYWKFIDPNDSMTLARLDKAELLEKGIAKCVKNRE